MSRYIVVEDPWHEYAIRFIEHIHRKYGYQAICFYTSRSEYVRQRAACPVLRSASVAAVYEVATKQLSEFAQYLRGRYDVAAVIPFNEPALSAATQLSEALSLSWSQPDTLHRFRDKHQLKAYLRSKDPSLRLNATCLVSTLAQVQAQRESAAFSKFVLKPNDGFGNRRIGVFAADATPQAIECYLNRATMPVLMEEYIDGVEYFVNGQTDAQGEVTVLAVFEYQRIAANGRNNIDHTTRKLPTSHPLFASLADYATRVVKATGLRRSPFHLEAKVDAHGPCLIEVAARLPGLGNAFLTSELHSAGLPRVGFDWIDVAAHYYLETSDYGPLRLDWSRYDSAAVRYVHGIATQCGRVVDVRGLSAIEALPQFMHWVKRPCVGEPVLQTVDCLSMPWNLLIKAEDEVAAEATEAQVRNLIAYDLQPNSWRVRVRQVSGVVQRAISMLRYQLDEWRIPYMSEVKMLSAAQASTCDFGRLWRRMRSAWQRRRELSRFGQQDMAFPPPTPPEHAPLVQEVIRWAEEYLARPHAELGRKGPICPFVKHTVDIGKYFVSVHAEIDGSDLQALRRVVLTEGAAMLKHSPNVGSKGAFSSLVMVFPSIPEQRLVVLDEIHNELKTPLMARDLMFSPFHKLSTKPSICNPDFKVFRAPFPALVVRHLDVRDIAFLGHNRDAFLHFKSRFAPLFAQGKVSDEFGYVRMYDEACARFDVSAYSKSR